MEKKTTATLIIVLATALQGCSSPENNTQSINKNLPITAPKSTSDKPRQLSFLKQCLINSDELQKLDQKYKTNNDEIHGLINEAKSYASTNPSENIKRTITPLIEYEVNYACYNISHLLMEELSNRIKLKSMSGKTQ